MQLSPKPNSRIPKLIIGAGLIISLALLIFFNFNYLSYKFNLLFRVSHFNNSDKVYLNRNILDGKLGRCVVYRLIRPITQEDVNSMNLTEGEKAYLKTRIQPELEPYLTEFDSYFDMHDMQKRKSFLMGTYVKKSDLKIKYQDKLVPDVFYGIVPDDDVYHERVSQFDLSNKMPANYMFADNLVYAPPVFLTDKDVTEKK